MFRMAGWNERLARSMARKGTAITGDMLGENQQLVVKS